MDNGIEIRRVQKGTIDFEFAESLFQLWMKGKTPQDLVDMFANTDRSFSIGTLSKTLNKYKWIDRRDKIINQIAEKNNQEIVLFTEKRLSMVNSLIALMEDELNNYIKDPNHNPKPNFFPKNSKDMDTLFRLFEFIKNGGVDKKQIDLGLTDFGLDIDDSTAINILDVISKVVTKQAKGEVIDADFFEELVSDEESIKFLNESTTKQPEPAEFSVATDKDPQSSTKE